MSRSVLRRLLSHGFFPRELPPTFSTVSFGSRVARNWATRPPKFGDGTKPSRDLRHSLARSGLLRRQLGVPNPIAYTGLSAEIADAWRDLDARIRRSPLSRSRPIFHRRGARAFLPQVSRQASLIPIRANIRAGQRLIVSTDVTRFYHSIYSHSIPWALHGKATAKANHSFTLAGNRIDRALRNCRDRQTIGIPIGPDASLIIAELILSEVDVTLAATIPGLRGLRYVDDYEIAFESHDHAEQAVGHLQETLANFELELNPRKTRLEDLPQPHEYLWAGDLRSQVIRKTARGQADDLVRLFDRAFEFALESPDEPVLRYLIGRLSGLVVERSNWRFYQHLLLQCITVEPGTIPAAAGHLIAGVQAGLDLDTETVEATLNRLLEVHAPLGHHNELAWAVWLALVLGLAVHTNARRALERTSDPVVVLLCLHAERQGRFSDPVDKTLWQSLMKRTSLYGPDWLLAYEALVKGWLPSSDGTDYVAADPFFAFLNQLGVRFYLERAVRKVQASRVPPSIGVAPVFYA